MRAHQNTWGRVSQVLKLGYRRYRMVHVWWGKGDRSGMLADVQASWHDSTVHVQRFFPPKVQKQVIVTLFDDVTDILLMYIGGWNKRKHAQDLGSLGLVWEFGSVVLACSPVSSSGKQQTLQLGYLGAS